MLLVRYNFLKSRSRNNICASKSKFNFFTVVVLYLKSHALRCIKCTTFSTDDITTSRFLNKCKVTFYTQSAKLWAPLLKGSSN